MDTVIVIMAGGVGTRFWPLSTDETPKQFLRLFGDRSMMQECYERIRGVVEPDRVLVLTSCDYIAMVREQLPAIPAENIIGEPMRRDTAAAVALSALICRKRFGNPVIVTLTADHFIEPVDLFLKTLQSAVRAASDNDVLYTFGIRPAFPATGYGYLERGSHIMTDNGIEHYGLLTFKEKPDMIITDATMPKMDGFELIKQLRSRLETAVIPIIMLTARQDKDSELKGIDAGADDYIVKPFDIDKLLSRIKMLLRRK